MISPEAIDFVTQGPEELRFEPTARRATLITSRLRMYLVLDTKAANVRIRVPVATRRKLRRALQESGVKLIERAS